MEVQLNQQRLLRRQATEDNRTIQEFNGSKMLFLYRLKGTEQ